MGPSDWERFQRRPPSPRLLHLIQWHRPSPGRRSSNAWSCRLMDAFIRRPCLPCGERSTSSRVPWLQRHYPPSSLLRTHPPPSRLRSLSRGVPGYTIYLAPSISRWGEDGFSSCLACPVSPCRPYHPAEVACGIGQIAACHAAFASEQEARPSELIFFEATCGFTCVTAR